MDWQWQSVLILKERPKTLSRPTCCCRHLAQIVQWRAGDDHEFPLETKAAMLENPF